MMLLLGEMEGSAAVSSFLKCFRNGALLSYGVKGYRRPASQVAQVMGGTEKARGRGNRKSIFRRLLALGINGSQRLSGSDTPEEW